MNRWLALCSVLLAAGALSWSCAGTHSTGAATQQAVTDVNTNYAFLGITADCRGEMFPCG